MDSSTTQNRQVGKNEDATNIKQANRLEDDNDMIIESSEDLEVVKSFDELGLREELLRGKPIQII